MVIADRRGLTNWATRVKTLLNNFGFTYVWNEPFTVDQTNFHHIFKSRVIDVFKQSWINNITTSAGLYSYRYFKSIFTYETYLNIIPKKYRIALTQLRLSSHQLRIETDRYGNQRMERNRRLCQFCRSNDIEDEYHFVIICPLYNVLRKNILKHFITFDQVFLRIPNLCNLMINILLLN